MSLYRTIITNRTKDHGLEDQTMLEMLISEDTLEESRNEADDL